MAQIKVLLGSMDLDVEDVLKVGYIAMVNMILLGYDERALVEDFVWTMCNTREFSKDSRVILT